MLSVIANREERPKYVFNQRQSLYQGDENSRLIDSNDFNTNYATKPEPQIDVEELIRQSRMK
jgi:hypothetical protein